MLQAVYDLDSHDESFGSPDTPEFKCQHSDSQKSDELQTNEGIKPNIHDEPFILATEDSPNYSNVSIRMTNVAEAQPAKENIDQSQVKIQEEQKKEPRTFKSFFLVNFFHKNTCKAECELENKQSQAQEQETKLGMSFVFSNFMEIKANRSESQYQRKQNIPQEEESNSCKQSALTYFIEKNTNQKQSQDQNKQNPPQEEQADPCRSLLFSNLAEKNTSKAQSERQKKSSQPQEESKSTKSFDLTNHIEVYSNKTYSSSLNKENHPQQAPLLPRVIQQTPARNIDQNEPLEESVNAADETIVQEGWTEKYQRQKLFSPAMKFDQIFFRDQKPISQQSGFWKIQTFKIEVTNKRKRNRPCQFWLGEKTRYLKNDVIVIQHQMSIQEAFLMLNDPEEIVEAKTQYAGANIIKGEITMIPYSKVKVKKTGNIIVLTVKKGNSFSFSDNKIKIIPENGSNRLFLRNAQIRSIKNCLLQPCTFRIKMSIIS